ncbi:MAG: AI-2E family transporter, partial [Actinomycetota bacterium]|nr:AI-2E family transporter [Actinomycetota bacterium]
MLTPVRQRPVEENIPVGIRTTAAWSWRMLVILGGLWVVFFVAIELQLVLVPVAIALLLSGLLQPVASWLRRQGLPRSVAAALVLFGGIAAVAGIITLVVSAVSNGLADLSDSVTEGIDQVRDWLVQGPLSLSQQQLDDLIDEGQSSLADNRELFTAGALATATTVGHLVTGFFLVLFALFFFLRDGREIWLWLVGLLPRVSREDIDGAGLIAWKTLISYVRATGLVAFVDAVGIGIGIAVLGVPLALPLAAVVFLGAFIPLIGSFLSGLLAVLVALVSNGPITALLVLGVVVVVMQVEGHLLQPLLLGRAVKIHPLAVILAIAAGLLVAGIVGALIAVPLAACVNVATIYLVRGRYAVAEAPIAAEFDPDPKSQSNPTSLTPDGPAPSVPD